jgi:RimJ/RimL family protein N-acetyltransferase
MDPAVVKYIGGVPSTEQQCWARITGYLGHWEFKGYGYWAIEEMMTGHYAGCVGFADFKRSRDPRFVGKPEMGWALAPSMQGKGYGSECLALALQWGSENLQEETVFCMIHKDHQRSLSLAQKVGFREASRDDEAVSLFLTIK